MDIKIRKKTGQYENWMPEKIVKAVMKSAERIAQTLPQKDIDAILCSVEKNIVKHVWEGVVPVEIVHALVESALEETRPDVAKSYKDYRNWAKRHAKMMEEVTAECNTIQFLGDKSNANADSELVSTKGVKKKDVLETAQYREYFLNAEEKRAEAEGYIYIHDKGSRQNTWNCSLPNLKAILTGGFEMSNVWYNEPKTLATAFDVVGDVTLMMASQQYGGFTISEVDSLLEPYAEKSFNKWYKKYYSVLMESKRNALKEAGADFDALPPDKKELIRSRTDAEAKEKAKADVLREIRQGFQGWEYKFNTVASSRGDYPFITATFGLCTSEWGKELCKGILETRKNGQGREGHKKPVLFPKLVFLYDENLHGPGKEMEDVFEAGVACSTKTMYPDWLSLTGEGYVPSIYKKYGLAISPMGCRAFLSPWYEKGGMYPADENDRPVFIGRFNIGVVSLHLPMILAKSRRESRNFYEVLDYYLEMIRKLHLRTYEYLGQMKASTNPLGYCEGGFLGGNLELSDKIEPILKSATASFGITALNELQQLYNGKSIAQDGQFALEVLRYINDKIEEFKKKDGRLYAIYGTPAESLCSKQIEQFRKEFGIITNVSDRPYVSNSFHCHVTEDITPIEKQDLE